MSTIKVDTIKNTSNVEVFTAKAWVNFNGIGSPAIRGSGNVSSIADNGVGNYIVNFTTAMTDANFCTVGLKSDASTRLNANMDFGGQTANNVTVLAFEGSTPTLTDSLNVFVAIFR